MSLKIKIMVKAVKIRMNQGENLESILNGYSLLTNEEKESIRGALGDYYPQR